MKKLPFLVTVCILTALLLCVPAIAAPVQQPGGELIEVEAEGFAPIKDGKKNEAKSAAERSAYRDALEKALGAYVQGITQMENFQVVKDKVFSQTQGIVKDFDVLREWVEDDIFYISAKCRVSVAALDGVLGPATIDALGNPRIMVLIDERVGDKQSFLSVTEGELLRVFEKAGYLIVDPAQAGALKDIDLQAARVSGNPDELRDIARTFNADVLITGKAYSRTLSSQVMSGVRIFGVASTVQLRAVLANSAYQLGSDTIEEKEKGMSAEDGAAKSFKTAASKAGKSIVHKIAYSMISGTAGGIPGRTVKIKIADISFKDVRRLKDALEGNEGVTGVYQRLYRNKNLEMDIVSDKTSEEIATILLDHGIDVEDLTGATVEGRSVGDQPGGR